MEEEVSKEILEKVTRDKVIKGESVEKTNSYLKG